MKRAWHGHRDREKSNDLRHIWKIVSKATARCIETNAGSHPLSLAIRRTSVTFALEVAGHWCGEGWGQAEARLSVWRMKWEVKI